MINYKVIILLSGCLTIYILDIQLPNIEYNTYCKTHTQPVYLTEANLLLQLIHFEEKKRIVYECLFSRWRQYGLSHCRRHEPPR